MSGNWGVLFYFLKARQFWRLGREHAGGQRADQQVKHISQKKIRKKYTNLKRLNTWLHEAGAYVGSDDPELAKGFLKF